MRASGDRGGGGGVECVGSESIECVDCGCGLGFGREDSVNGEGRRMEQGQIKEIRESLNIALKYQWENQGIYFSELIKPHRINKMS